MFRQTLGGMQTVRIHAAPVFASARIEENIPGELSMYWFRARGYLSDTCATPENKAAQQPPLRFREEKSMVMKFHGNVRGEVRVNFLALFASKPHIFMLGALKLSGVVRANVRLSIAIPRLFFCP